MDITSYLSKKKDSVDKTLEKLVPPAKIFPSSIHEAMRYSLFAGGKRVRPILAIAAAEAIGAKTADLLPLAGTLELVHTYSLIHDDLPAMDDDDFRRGRPTNHKVYGEAIAILAGDALLTEAFILLSHPDASSRIPADRLGAVIHEIAHCAGSHGMVGGQVVDMESEGKHDIDLATVLYIHTHKTGALIKAAVKAGALLGGADEAGLAAMTRYGEAIGLAFQIADDILDIEGTTEEIGKDAGSDEARGKATYPAVVGLAEAKKRAAELAESALEALTPF